MAQNGLKKAINSFLGLIYPERCAFCGKIEKSGVCAECEKKLEKLRLEFKSLPQSDYRQTRLDAAYACFEYDGIAASAVKSAKFCEQPYRLYVFGEYLFSLYGQLEKIGERYDYIIPVPDTPRRRFKRGFSHTAIFSKYLAEKCGVKYRADILYKKYETKGQHTLPFKRRGGNLAGSMTVKNEADIKGKSLLIADDIITTGSTADYCAKILKMYGAEKVTAISFCAVIKNKKGNGETENGAE